MFSPPCAFRCSRISTTSERLRIEEAATKSTPCSPSRRSGLVCLFQPALARAMDSRQVDAFVFAQIAVVQHFTDNFVTFDSGHFHADQAVIYQHGVANGQVAGEAFVSQAATISLLPTTDLSVVKVKVWPAFRGNVVTAFQFDGADLQDLWCRAGLPLFPGLAHHLRVLDTLAVFSIVAVGRSSGASRSCRHPAFCSASLRIRFSGR